MHLHMQATMLAGKHMRTDELLEVIDLLRSAGTDLRHVEAKRSRSELPKKLWQTLSAFSNSPDGGVVVLGLDEESGFEACGVDDPKKIMQDLASMCTHMEPKVQAIIDVHRIDGKALVVAEVPEMLPTDKPCYYPPAGTMHGAFVRVADGDRKLTEYEILTLKSAREQPTWDEAPVPGATLGDLDAEALNGFLARVRGNRRKLAALPDDEILKHFKVIVPANGGAGAAAYAPSLAALLAFGSYPQRFYPQLAATVVVLPGTAKGETGPSGERYLDNVRAEGAIGEIVAEVLQVLGRHMRRSGVVTGIGREERPEYPYEALREALVNALAHRDLGPRAQGAAVQVEFYRDRLTITNPGGLYGPISVETLGQAGLSSARNRALMRMLEEAVIPGTDHAVAEQRGFGISSMIRELRGAGLAPPIFEDEIATFRVTFPRQSLLSAEIREWLARLGPESLSPDQQMALALMRGGAAMTNSRYRQISGADSRDATRELAELVSRGLIRSTGAGRWTQYVLTPEVDTDEPALPAATPRRRGERGRQILALLRERGPLSRSALQESLGLSQPSVSRWLKRLREHGLIELTTPTPKSPEVKYKALGRRR